MVSHTAEKVRGLQSYAQDLRTSRTSKYDARIAEALAHALRGHMPRAGHVKVNPDISDAFEQAQAEYRREQELEPPVFAIAKFRVMAHWFMWDEARLHLRTALELHLPKGKRSTGAQWLAVVLHNDELDDYALFRARDTLVELYGKLKPFN